MSNVKKKCKNKATKYKYVKNDFVNTKIKRVHKKHVKSQR